MCIKLSLHLMKQNWLWEDDKLSEARVVPVEYKGIQYVKVYFTSTEVS